MRLAADLMFDELGIETAQWVGTSMGGAIGTDIVPAGIYEPRLQGHHPPVAPAANCPNSRPPPLQRIRAYAGQPPAFDTVLELEMFFRQVYQPTVGWKAMRIGATLPNLHRRLPTGG